MGFEFFFFDMLMVCFFFFEVFAKCGYEMKASEVIYFVVGFCMMLVMDGCTGEVGEVFWGKDACCGLQGSGRFGGLCKDCLV